MAIDKPMPATALKTTSAALPHRGESPLERGAIKYAKHAAPATIVQPNGITNLNKSPIGVVVAVADFEQEKQQ